MRVCVLPLFKSDEVIDLSLITEDRCIKCSPNVDRRVISLDWMRAKSLPDTMTDIMGKRVSHEFTHTLIPLLPSSVYALQPG